MRLTRLKALWAVAFAGGILFVIALRTAVAAVRFDVVGSPTEVIGSGRSEVLGSVNLVVRGSGNVTGTSSGGATQIGLVFANPALAIDNTTSSGIRLSYSAGFASAVPAIVGVENRVLNGRCAGFVTINFPPGAVLADGDFVKIEGIRGRIDASSAIVSGTDLFVDLQSVNDPAAMNFTPDRIRVAKSLKGLKVEVLPGALSFDIRVSEGFERAFVDLDASNDGVNSNDRTDSGSQALGAPTNSTQISVTLYGIPPGVADVAWPGGVTDFITGASLRLLGSSYPGETSTAVYSFEAIDQAGKSDQVIETFILAPALVRGSGACNTDALAASAALGPPVPQAEACDAPSAAGARPRFLEIYEPVIASLSPTTATVAGDPFTLTVYGAGFVPGCAVLWNGTSRPTTYVDRNRLKAAIPAADIAKVGSATVAVAAPAEIGGSVSNVLTFNVVEHPLSLFFPRLSTSGGATAGSAEREYTGLALANVSGRIARLKLTALDESGVALAGPDISNPVALTLRAGEQSSFMASEAFGHGISRVRPHAWIKAEGNVEQVVGFFLLFDDGLSQLDGADVSSNLQEKSVLAEIEPTGINQLSIANPGDEQAEITVELVRADGALRVPAALRAIPPGGVLMQSLEELFPGTALAATDYLRVSADSAVAPFQYFGKPAGERAGLNGQDAAAGGTVLYAPHYVVGGAWQSTVSLINLAANAGTVSIRFMDDDGNAVGGTQVVPIEARGKVYLAGQRLFADPGAAVLPGYLEIRSSVRLAGSVVYGSSQGPGPYAALPLVSSLSGQSIFSHVASGELFYTGLAILNPGDSPARALIRVFDRNGNVVASKMEEVPARGRRSRLLTEYFPGLIGVPIRSGYIIVSSPVHGLASFALFGTDDRSVLSAIPAQTLP